jgi:formamidopyrimidine-DNA glycosylase
MPELPDVEMFKQEARQALNRRIEYIRIWDPGFVTATQDEFKKHITGNELHEVWRKGKYLFLETGNQYAVVLHFGMTGFLKYAPGKKEAPEYVKLTFEMDDAHHLHYVSKRKLGRVEITRDSGKYADELDLGPDPLQIGEDAFREEVKASRAMVKSFLMDQSSVSGIGNMYSDEILYQAGIHPRVKSGILSDGSIGTLYRQMKRVLETAIENEADIARMPGTWLLPNREEGIDCPRCGEKIRKTRVLGRATYYCPSCQKKQ